MAGSTQIKYVVSDGNGGVDTGRVNVTINGINDIPVVTGESLSLACGFDRGHDRCSG